MKNHITKVRSRHAVKPRAVQPVVMWTPALGRFWVKMLKTGEKMTFGKCEGKIHGVFLLSSKETDMNSISFTIALGKLEKKGELTEETKSSETLTGLFQHATPIYLDMDEVYEITFEDYIMHQTRNESYTSYDEQEIRKGNPLIIFEKSRLLDFLPQLTDCTSYPDGTFYPEKWTHYRIYCVDHIIDVISCSKPKIRKCKYEKVL